jgi:hypothetical protein
MIFITAVVYLRSPIGRIHVNHRLAACSALAIALSAGAALAKANDIDADKSKRRVVTDPMTANDCTDIYKAAGGKYFPQAASHTTYKQSDCATKLFFDGPLRNAAHSQPNFDTLPICLGMQENINHYLDVYKKTDSSGTVTDKCRRLTSTAWSQDLNQKFIWCIAKGHLKGGAIWLANNRMMSKGWAATKLSQGALYVTASEACFWHKVMGKPFPLSGKDKAEETAQRKSTARSKSKGGSTSHSSSGATTH